MKRVTPPEPANRQPQPFYQTEALKRLRTILGTARIKPATWAKQGTDCESVKSNQRQRKPYSGGREALRKLVSQRRF
jgi:hypothetical protein